MVLRHLHYFRLQQVRHGWIVYISISSEVCTRPIAGTEVLFELAYRGEYCDRSKSRTQQNKSIKAHGGVARYLLKWRLLHPC